MALHFSANQFNRAFDARQLGNWEVARRYPDRPHARTGHTRIIANDRGHLLPGVAKAPNNGAWGHFVPTWRMPKRITRKIADELRSPKPTKIIAIPQLQTHDPRPEPEPETLPNIETKKEPTKEDVEAKVKQRWVYLVGQAFKDECSTKVKRNMRSACDFVQVELPSEEIRHLVDKFLKIV